MTSGGTRLKWLGIAVGADASRRARAPSPMAASARRRRSRCRRPSRASAASSSAARGRSATTSTGSGAPLLLIHSINAAGSAYEVRPLVEALTGERRVYAVGPAGLRLLGPVGPALRHRALRRGDPRHARRDRGGCRSRRDRRAGALALVASSWPGPRASGRRRSGRSPSSRRPASSADRRRAREGRPEHARGAGAVRRADRAGLEPRPLQPARHAAEHPLLPREDLGSKRIDEGLLDYDYLTTHQPGAEHAPYAFVSGRLFTANIRARLRAADRPGPGRCTARGATSRTSRRPAGPRRAGTGASSRSTPARCRISSGCRRCCDAYRGFLGACRPRGLRVRRRRRDRRGRSGAAWRRGSAG